MFEPAAAAAIVAPATACNGRTEKARLVANTDQPPHSIGHRLTHG